MAVKGKQRILTRPRQQQQVKKRIIIYPIERGLTPKSAKQYRWQLDAFLEWLSAIKYQGAVITDTKLVEFDSQRLEGDIIEYLDKYLNEEKGLKHATLNTAMSAIIHFCDINNVILNRRRIGKLSLPRDRAHKDDRAYTRKEIEKLIDAASDRRFKVVFLLLANGMRIGAVPELEIRNLVPRSIKIKDDPEPKKIYQIWVYSKSEDHRYYTFVTPECAQAIDDYLAWRTEKTKEDTTISPDSEHPLIREQFSLTPPRRQDVAIPWKVTQGSIERTIERTVEKAGINTKGKVMLTHGFRKWAITQMKKAKVDFSDREYLVGHKHSRGLDVNYDRIPEDERLEEWSKAINNLTIDSAYHLKNELEIIQGETAQQIASLKQENEQIRRDNEKIRQDMKKFLEYAKPALDARSQAASMATKSALDASSQTTKAALDTRISWFKPGKY